MQSSTAREELRHDFDRNLQIYTDFFLDKNPEFQINLFSRDLAFSIISLTTMYRMTGAADYLSQLRWFCEVMLQFEVEFDDIIGTRASSFIMRRHGPEIPAIDCHSAALLSLTIAAPYIGSSSIAAAIERGLSSYVLETSAIDFGIPRKIDTVAAMLVDREGCRHSHDSFWNFTAGLSLRLFAAIETSSDLAIRAIADRHHERLQLFELVLRHQLERSISEHTGMVEIRCSPYSSETNSETQPWVMMGLLAKHGGAAALLRDRNPALCGG
jgi:hypothetical protein